MGIDIGDLDLVVHDGAPSSPNSYLQRLGRAGRRSGHRRVIFTVADAHDLLLILGVLARVRRNDLGQIDPQQGARLVLGQQAIAIAHQLFIADRSELHETLRWSPTFAGLDADIEATIDHLLANRWLRADGPKVVLGPEGQARFGGHRGINDLLASFSSRTGMRVVDESGGEVGTVDRTQIEETDNSASGQGFVLSGRQWTVVRVDRSDGVVTVRPGGQGKPPSWRGPMLEVERATWEAVREVLADTDVPVQLDTRSSRWLEEERERWSTRLEEPVRSADSSTVIDSFCGAQVHRAALEALRVEGSAEGTTCEFQAPLQVLASRARALLEGFDAVLDGEAARIAPQLAVRFPELVPPSVLFAEARRFHVDGHGLHRVLSLLAKG